MAPVLRSKSSSVATTEGFVEGTDPPLVGSHASNGTFCSATGVDTHTPGGSVPVQEEIEIVLDHGSKDAVELHTIPPVGGKKGLLFNIPSRLYQKLKPHQKDGLLWLWELQCGDIPGGIVADDMGLGKTLQTTTFISGLFFSKIIHMVMIIAPVSILESWSEELAAVGLKGLVHHICSSSDVKALQIVVKEGGILLTSYEMFTRHHTKLESPSRRWDYVVLDEAHRIKNFEACVTKTMKSIKCNKKILMTGTPLPKNLLDIYALMDFIQPGILGDKDAFDENFMRPVKQGQYSNSAKGDKEEYLKALACCWSTISPYMLRRNKSVLIETGDLTCKKHDVIIWLRLTKLQIKLYEKLHELDREAAKFRPQEKELSFTLSMLYQCICNDPYLLWNILDDEKSGLQVKRLAWNLLESVDVDRESYDNTRGSCKTHFILDLIKQMFNEEQNQPQSINENMQGGGEVKKLKILVFCQQIYMLDRLQEILNDNDVKEKGIIRIDGSVSKKLRDKRIKEFDLEAGPCIFLLSAKVGGEGLNLTMATRVIIVDHSWNISDDNQIADRVYRMGQKKDVIIYRVFTCATIEEHLYKTQLIKGRLAEAITEGKVCTSLVKKEDGKVLVLPETFNRSKTCASLKSILGDTLELDSGHLRFLRTHNRVRGITNQTLVFSKVETLLADVSFEESSSEASVLKKKPGKSTKEIKTASQPVVSWAGRLRSHVPKDAVSKQQETSLVVGRRIFPIPANKVGLLYGKGGTTIHKISIQSSTCINVEEDTEDNKHDPNRSVTITGTLEDFVRAKALILDELDKGGKKGSMQDCRPGTKDAYVSVPEDKMGLVIGKGGKTVNAIETQSGATIKQVNKENKFRITGTTEQIKAAESLIADKVSIPRSRHSEQSGGNKASFPQPSGPVGGGGSTGATGSTSSCVLDGVIQTTRPVMFEGSSVMAVDMVSIRCPPGNYYTARTPRIALSLHGSPGYGVQAAPYRGPQPGYGVQAAPYRGPPPGYGVQAAPYLGPPPGYGVQAAPYLGPPPGYGVQAAPYPGPLPGYGVQATPYLGPPPGYGVQAAPYRGPPPGYDAQQGPRHGLPAYSFRWPPHQQRPAPHS